MDLDDVRVSAEDVKDFRLILKTFTFSLLRGVCRLICRRMSHQRRWSNSGKQELSHIYSGIGCMANMDVYICDDVVRNILVRLPGRALLRSRCACKHWNDLISDPCFMKSRSRPMILFPFIQPMALIDDNVPAQDKTHSIVRNGSRSPQVQERETDFGIVGTLNGIVLLTLTQYPHSDCCELILYNPLTCASNMLLSMEPSSEVAFPSRVFGLFYAANKDDLKIVRLEVRENPNRLTYICDVFDIKTSSWSTSPQHLERDFHFLSHAATFLNGFLYWSTSSKELSCFGILVFNVNKMVFSKLEIPNGDECADPLLGSLDGCLCMVNCKIGSIRFDVWLMKQDQCSWMKAHSFTFGLEPNSFNLICILGNGKILMINDALQLVIYDTSKHSYKTLNGLTRDDDYNWRHLDFDPTTRDKGSSNFRYIHSIEYVESLVSPFDIMSLSFV
ncbi:hypothetical protein QVD17_35779 [Tagetes erecta]|uniref:F-box domain-containing protein n=1 Tax=Tagetes erecta TaxID=13708 RepID=A0AAD8JSU1_TARER|nr:hypothetical protein QVD17_35779 [Tagetes erecta]